MSIDEAYTSRMPELLRDCVADNSGILSKEQNQRLLKLVEDLINNTEIPLPSQFADQGPTGVEWEKLLAGKRYTWQNSPWFLSELYMYYLVLVLTDYYTTGVDPFHASKVAELKGETLWRLRQSAVDIPTKSRESPQRHEQLKQLMKLCMWGNKADGCNKEVRPSI